MLDEDSKVSNSEELTTYPPSYYASIPNDVAADTSRPLITEPPPPPPYFNSEPLEEPVVTTQPGQFVSDVTQEDIDIETIDRNNKKGQQVEANHQTCDWWCSCLTDLLDMFWGFVDCGCCDCDNCGKYYCTCGKFLCGCSSCDCGSCTCGCGDCGNCGCGDCGNCGCGDCDCGNCDCGCGNCDCDCCNGD